MLFYALLQVLGKDRQLAPVVRSGKGTPFGGLVHWST